MGNNLEILKMNNLELDWTNEDHNSNDWQEQEI